MHFLDEVLDSAVFQTVKTVWIFLGDDFRNYFHMQCSWFDSGYMYGVSPRGSGEFHIFSP